MTDTTAPKDALLTNAQYDLLKKIVTLGLPAAGALYAGLAQIWGWPNAENVVGSIALLTVFLGVVLGFSGRSFANSEYKFDGEVVVDESNPLKPTYDFQTSQDLAELVQKKELIFKVTPLH
jgi:hypothetical protein